MRGTLIVVAAVIAGSSLTAPAALASSVSRSGGLLLYVASPSEKNKVSISEIDGAISITDVGASIVPGAMCRAQTDPPRVQMTLGSLPPASTHARCNADLLSAVVVLAGDEADQVSIQLPSDVLGQVSGGPGDDLLVADAGASVLQGEDGDDQLKLVGSPDALDIAEGGNGNDIIDAVAGAGSALVRCGPGFDIVELDRVDRPSDGCEGRSYPSPRAPADVQPIPPPDQASDPALAPTAPRLPGSGGGGTSPTVAAAASDAWQSCLLKPRKRDGKLTVQLTGVEGRGRVYWDVFRTKHHKVIAKYGEDSVIAHRREVLTSIRASQGFVVGVETPVPCPNQ